MQIVVVTLIVTFLVLMAFLVLAPKIKDAMAQAQRDMQMQAVPRS